MNEAKQIETYVMTLQDAEKLFERKGVVTYFRRMDHLGRTHFLIVGYDIEYTLVQNHEVKSKEKISMSDAAVHLESGGWERLT